MPATTEAAPGTDPGRLRGTRALAWASVWATLLLIAMGGAVRATDSGLACPDWPACYGQWIPPADLNMWLEHSHRLVAGVVGLMIAALVVATFRQRRRVPGMWPLSLVAFVLVIVQAGLGAAVVLLHLRAGLVTSHLAMSFIVVASLIGVAVLADRGPVVDGGRTSRRHPVTRPIAVVAGLVFAQAALGSQATGRGAAYVFNAFPIWLATDAWTGHVREVLHITHRAGGYVVAAAVIWLAIRVRRAVPPVSGRVARLVTIAVVLVAVQVALGIANVLTQATVASAIGHLAVASWLWAALVAAAVIARADGVLPVPGDDVAHGDEPGPGQKVPEEVTA